MAKTLRAFIAVELPDAVKDALHEKQQAFKRSGLPFKWVKGASIHLTLKFLGDVMESDVDGIVEVMEQCAAGFAPMTFKLQGLGAFPGFKNPRVFWAGLSGDAARLGALAQALENGLEPLGFEKESRRFSAHVTLGRARGRVDSQALLREMDRAGELSSPPFQVRGVTLFKSDLKPSGAVYTALARTAFKG